MADGEIRIDTKLDTDGLDKGLNDIKKKMDGAGKTIDAGTKKTAGLTQGLKGLNAGALATAGGMAAAAVAVKKTVDALNQCEAAYREQQKAELALQQAAKNNPYLNSESVANLKAFAGELQKVSNIGDEMSIKVMAQLAATGRTEDQIRDIMAAAADMAAVTGDSLESAAQKLNATLNGNAGMLGRQITGINNLTKAELENGKAIELVAAQYKGSAQATADVGTQLSNAWGDFKENIGRGWSRVTEPVKQFFLDVLGNINEATAKTAALKDAGKKNAAGTATAADTKILLDDAQARLDQLKTLNEKFVGEAKSTQKTLEELQAEWDAKYGKMNSRMRRGMSIPARPTSASTTNAKGGAYVQAAAQENMKEMGELEKQIEKLTDQYNKLKAAEDAEAAAADKEAKANQRKADAQKRDEDAAAFIQENARALTAQVEAMRIKAEVTGEEIDAGEMYNAYMQSYIDLLTKSNGLVTKNNQAAKARLAALQEWAEKAKNAADAERLLAEADELVAKYADQDALESFAARQQELEAMRRAVDEKEVQDAREKAARIKAIDEEMAENRRRLWASLGGEINDYAQQIDQIVQNAANMALETENNRMKAELANLELKYRKGEMGEEEYQEKVAEAKKKGAKIQYQIEMAQWASSILAATANTAVGVTKALAEGGFPAGIVMGALVGAAGAVQLAAILGAKPIPHFASGGFVGGMNGASLGADNTLVAARGGELMVNASQQRELWDVLNGGARGTAAGGVSFTVNNSASNLVTATPQINRNQIELMIDARVNESLKDGRYNDGLNAAQAGMSGTFYGL